MAIQTRNFPTVSRLSDEKVKCLLYSVERVNLTDGFYDLLVSSFRNWLVVSGWYMWLTSVFFLLGVSLECFSSIYPIASSSSETSGDFQSFGWVFAGWEYQSWNDDKVEPSLIRSFIRLSNCGEMPYYGWRRMRVLTRGSGALLPSTCAVIWLPYLNLDICWAGQYLKYSFSSPILVSL